VAAVGFDTYFLNADADLKSYAGLTELRDGQHELRDKWNAGDRDPTTFYRSQVGDSYLHDLARWHASGETLNWAEVVHRRVAGEVLDFGAGIGSYSLLAASKPEVQTVYCHDVNETNRAFVAYRAEKYGLAHKIRYGLPARPVDALLALDVLEHLPARIAAIREFAGYLRRNGLLLMTFTADASGGEHPMHLMTRSEIIPVMLSLYSRFRRLPPHNERPRVWMKR
jgi:SAM-dependent methyltransferase